MSPQEIIQKPSGKFEGQIKQLSAALAVAID